MKNLTKFNNIGEYNSEVGEEILSQPNVSLINNTGEVMFSNTLPPFEEQYLTFIPLQDGQFKFTANDDNSGATISYSLDYGTTWTVLAFDTYTPTVEAGHKIYWKGEGFETKYYTPSVSYTYKRGIGHFASTCDFDAEGDPASLHYGDDFNKEVYYSQVKKWYKNYYSVWNYGFYGLFAHCNIVNARNIKLMGATNSDGLMFGLGMCCYQFMFGWCTKLVSAPELPCLKTSTYCYANMFQACSSLVTAPRIASLNANDRPMSYAYNNMFDGCYLLSENIPTSLPYMWGKDGDTNSDACYASMFHNCRAMTTAPTLPSMQIPSNGYLGMFDGCTSLNYIKAMFVTPITSPKNDYTLNWVKNVSASGTFVKNSAATWNLVGCQMDGNLGPYCSGIPSGWTVQTASA